ncbi:MAG TPA: acyl-CoA dehydrogenase family protein [Rugosimonospora sp.]|nr:acyl-CoA dehydrogenase family protein [Rugosimonospora sp.]
MSLVDERLARLRSQVREWAGDLRAHALELDRDPSVIHRYLSLPAVRFLATMGVPRQYHRPDPIGGYVFDGATALERVIVLEELACADVGMLVASPGPLLAGVLVQVAGDERQRAWFYERVLARPLWTCFALTEPEHGSDAAFLQTSIARQPDGAVLVRGAKRYVGNAARAQLAVVFGRTGGSVFGIGAVLLDTSAPGFSAEVIDTIGLRGAAISAVRLDGVEVPGGQVLGRHLSPSRRGMWAFTRTFNLLRPGVAAIALGIARAAHEYTLVHLRRPARCLDRDLDDLGRDIDGTRALVHRAASTVDARPEDGHLASAAKLRAVRLAERATGVACAALGPGARFEHPLLDKMVRDTRGMEFIEGTSNMQRLNLFHSTLAGRLDGAPVTGGG